jgi:hypothetical protein
VKTPGGEYPPLALAEAPFLPKLAQMPKGQLALSVELMMMMVACLALMASLIFVGGKIDTGDPDEISHNYLQGV